MVRVQHVPSTLPCYATASSICTRAVDTYYNTNVKYPDNHRYTLIGRGSLVIRVLVWEVGVVTL